MLSFELIFTTSNIDFHLTLTWSIFCNQESIVWSTKNPFSNFRINNCFCQIPFQSVFEVLFKLILNEFNEFVFGTLGSLLLSELLASSRICHGGSPLSASHRNCTLLSEAECQIINNLLTELARAVPGNIGPLSCARSVLPRPRAIIPPYGPRARLVSGYNFSFLLIQAHS